MQPIANAGIVCPVGRQKIIHTASQPGSHKLLGFFPSGGHKVSTPELKVLNSKSSHPGSSKLLCKLIHISNQQQGRKCQAGVDTSGMYRGSSGESERVPGAQRFKRLPDCFIVGGDRNVDADSASALQESQKQVNIPDHVGAPSLDDQDRSVAGTEQFQQ